MFRVCFFVIFYVFAFLQVSISFAEKRVALVIGNSAYKHVGALENPVNDADLMARTLKALNFEVIVAKNVTQQGMKVAVSRYARLVQKYGSDTIGLVYYAGHGVQVDGLNYLIPVDAQVSNEADLSIWAFPANDLLFAMGKLGNRVNIIIFDACRNNPYRQLFRSAQGGLASMAAPEGSFVAFSAQPGAVAADGIGKNSPFTRSLAKHLLTPRLKLDDVLRRVGKDVYRQSKKKQRPWLQTDIYDDLCLTGGCGSVAQSDQSHAELKAMRKRLAALEDRLRREQSGKSKKTGKTVAVGNLPKASVSAGAFKHGYKFDDCNGADWCPKMIVVRGGSFVMGSNSTENGRFSDEGPTRLVTIRKLAVGRFEVTFDQWVACVSGGGCNGYHPSDQGWGGNRPVINVSWSDAKSYLSWLSGRTGRRYRLLTEAEWEYVASGGRTSPFWWGSSISTNQANFDGRYGYGNNAKGVYRRSTVPVSRFKANQFGLHNVHGNVMEWVEDCWHENYVNAPTDGSAWLKFEDGDCSRRVYRGGAWNSNPIWLRTRARFKANREFRTNDIGFRVARTLDN